MSERDLDREAMAAMAKGWNRLSDRYVEKLFDELDEKPFDRELLARFAAQVVPDSLVADLGCGPGHVARYLARQHGLRMVGVDLCKRMVENARRLTPELEFREGNLLALDVADSTWGGAVAFYSLINLVREDVPLALAEIARSLSPAAPLVVAVHRGIGTVSEKEVFGEPVPMAATLFEVDEMSRMVEAAGFDSSEVVCRPPYANEYQTERVYILARRR